MYFQQRAVSLRSLCIFVLFIFTFELLKEVSSHYGICIQCLCNSIVPYCDFPPFLYYKILYLKSEFLFPLNSTTEVRQLGFSSTHALDQETELPKGYTAYPGKPVNLCFHSALEIAYLFQDIIFLK